MTQHGAGVLVEARSFGESAQRAFNRAHPRFEPLVGQAFFIDAIERKHASIAAPFKAKMFRPMKRDIGTIEQRLRPLRTTERIWFAQYLRGS
jgi:hypothetical protein